MLKYIFIGLTLIPLNTFAAKVKKTNVKIFQISKANSPAYAKASFDSKIITRLKKGQKLYGLKKKVEGLDGLGLFHKVRLKKGLYAYILDTSVESFALKKGTGLGSKGGKRSGGISGRANKKLQQKSAKGNSPYANYSVPYAKSYGLVFSTISYGVEFAGETRKSNELFYGLKLSGAWWKMGFPLDMSLYFNPSSPSLFDSFTQDHKGTALFADFSLPLEWKKGERWSLFGHIGAVVSYYKFNIKLGGNTTGSSKTEFGASAGLGGGYRFGRYMAKLEGKYMYVGAKHTAVQLSLQRIF